MGNVLKIYLLVRRPRNFLVLLLIFITTSLLAHGYLGYDVEFGITNLSLSIEATIAGAVLMVVAEESAELQRQTVASQGQMLAALLAIAEAQKDMLADHTAMLRAIRDADDRLLKALTEKEEG
jgi:hypothetical protein